MNTRQKVCSLIEEANVSQQPADTTALQAVSIRSTSVINNPQTQPGSTRDPNPTHLMQILQSAYQLYPYLAFSSFPPSPIFPLQNPNYFIRQSQGRSARTVFSDIQISELEKQFKIRQYLSSNERFKIASSLGLSETQVKTWFQNRRMKEKKDLRNHSSDNNKNPTKINLESKDGSDFDGNTPGFLDDSN
ncbi:hypothetical protein ACTXT7_003345 [Hymenolepis weldensis]